MLRLHKKRWPFVGLAHRYLILINYSSSHVSESFMEVVTIHHRATAQQMRYEGGNAVVHDNQQHIDPLSCYVSRKRAPCCSQYKRFQWGLCLTAG